MIFIFKNMTIFWDISKWNRRQKKWDGGSNKDGLDIICVDMINGLITWNELIGEHK